LGILLFYSSIFILSDASQTNQITRIIHHKADNRQVDMLSMQRIAGMTTLPLFRICP